MLYNNVSVRQVISKVLTDNNLQEETHRISDMIEWAGEAMEKINAFPSLEIHVAGKEGEEALTVTNYQAALPANLHQVIQVAYAEEDNYDGPFYPMRYSSGSFNANKGITIPDSTTTEDEKANQTGFSIDLTYVITPGYIKINAQTGLLILAYTSIPIDEEGYPMVPNDTGFIDALYWYITMKLLYPMWVQGTIRDAIYYDARRSWNYYSKQAYGNAMMPNPDQMESIKNTWNRLIPELGDHNGFYSTTGQRQEIRNQTNRFTYLSNTNNINSLPDVTNF